MKLRSLVSLFAASAALGAMEPELVPLWKNTRDFYSAAPKSREAERWLGEMKPDGSWADIDYADQRRGHWNPRTHLARVQEIARSYANPRAKLAGEEEVRKAVLRGVDFWIEADPISPNWWHQSIGTPQHLLAILFTLGDFPPELLERLRPILDRSQPGMTGQNKVWLAGIHFEKGIFYNRPDMVREAVRAIDSELVVAAPGKEGLQPDWSYHQHGPQLQFGNYGLNYWTDMTKWARILAGTAYAFPPEKIDLLINYFNYGLRWTLFDGQMDFSACGRQIILRRMEEKFRTVDAAARTFRKTLGEKGEALNLDYDFSGNRFFPDSDYMIHRSRECFFSVKMTSSRTVGSETVNSENQLGRLLGHGAVMTMSHAKEIIGMGALWNWRWIPGVTALQDNSSLLCKDPHLRNKSAFVGGLSNGETGFAAMEFDNGEIGALKSYFFSGQSLFAVGSRISSEKDAPLHTAVAQHRSAEGAPPPVFNAEGRLRHGAFQYWIPERKGVFALEGAVTGNWKRVTDALSDEPVKGRIFAIGIDHGVRPRNASYAYAVGWAEEPLPEFKRLAASSDAIHAISVSGVVMAAFYEPGSVELPDGTKLTARQPSLALLRNGELQAVDPARKYKNLEFEMGGKKYRFPAPPL